LAEDIPSLIKVHEATNPPYSLVLSYPRPTGSTVESRVKQLKELGVTHLEFSGPLRIGNLSLLGKGVAGMVIAGLIDGRKVALKIRREDSRRNNLVQEGVMLQAANNVGVGPLYIGITNDVLAMEFVEGTRLPLWLGSLKGRGRKARLKATLASLLDQCFRLDQSRLDHGELSRAHKNVMVSANDRPWILDFESSSRSRRPSNFTSLAQYLFLGGTFTRKTGKILGPVRRSDLLRCLQEYKADISKVRFRAALAAADLTIESGR
jgi:putative serine/threonine protein kinase